MYSEGLNERGNGMLLHASHERDTNIRRHCTRTGFSRNIELDERHESRANCIAATHPFRRMLVPVLLP